ncbi:MAG: Trm112 family protein [Candidatus Omnitrophica bacterium]|nr:Trm112 family protein [Candidatus Omnitrophota bacterium]
MATIDQTLLEILACPKCKSKVVLEGERIVCTSTRCGLRFPIRDGIPVMLIEEAEQPAR